jgi:hypothetical protein
MFWGLTSTYRHFLGFSKSSTVRRQSFKFLSKTGDPAIVTGTPTSMKSDDLGVTKIKLICFTRARSTNQNKLRLRFGQFQHPQIYFTFLLGFRLRKYLYINRSHFRAMRDSPKEIPTIAEVAALMGRSKVHVKHSLYSENSELWCRASPTDLAEDESAPAPHSKQGTRENGDSENGIIH